MEQLINFNGVRILLTTGQDISEIQNFVGVPVDIILSVYPGRVKVLSGVKEIIEDVAGEEGT